MGPDSCAQGLLAHRRALTGLVVSALLGVSATSAHADSTINVTTTSDAPTAGQCSLREAITYANGTAEGDCAPGTQSGTTTINIPAGTYTLIPSNGGLALSRNAILNGAGASSTTISGGNAVQVLSIAASVQLTINGVTISKGNAGNPLSSCSIFAACPAGPGNNGGGIANAGSLTLVNSAVSGNAAGPGFTQTFGFVLCGGFPFPDCSSRPGGTGGNGGNGGGIYNNGQLTIQNSMISGNNAGAGSDGGPGATGTGSNAGAGSAGGGGGFGGEGGGILNDTAGTATITNTTISGNSAGAGGNGGQGSDANSGTNNGGAGGFAGSGGVGGGIVNFGKLTLTGSTLSANSTGQGGGGGAGGNPSGGGSAGAGRAGGFGGSGGAFYADSSSPANLTNDTINGNTASAGGTGTGGDGGAVWHFDGLLQMSFVTVTNNSAVHSTGGVLNDFGTITETDSIIASNTAGPGQPLNCTAGQVTDEGNNVVFGDNSCPGTNGDPKLGPLTGANGGPTATMALEPGSVAIDHVPLMQCPVTVDQRGVARPEGAACDAGAYEVAPPAIASPNGTGISTSAATVTANINPNFSAHDTTVIVKYGTTPAYGSTASPQDLGAGGKPVSFSANISGLSPGTTYHFQIVAANGDGTSTSGDGTFRTTLPTVASITSSSSAGPVLSLVISCNGGSTTSRCSGPIRLTSHITTQGGSIVAVTAAKKRPKPKGGPKKKTKKVVVGSGKYSVATGKHSTIKLKLNAAGLKALAARYKLPVTVTLTGAGTTRKTVTLSYARLHLNPAYQWAFSKTFAYATELKLSGLRRKSRVTVVCHGGGCPFGHKSFAAPKHGSLDLAPALKQRRLSVGSTVDLQITAANTVGEVVRFTVLAGKLPKESFLCMPPGARTPSACTS